MHLTQVFHASLQKKNVFNPWFRYAIQWKRKSSSSSINKLYLWVLFCGNYGNESHGKTKPPGFFCLDCRGMYKIKCSKEPETNAFHSYKWIAGFKNNRIWSSYKINVFGSMRMSTRYHRLDNYNYKMALLCVPIFTLLLRLFYKLTLTDDGVGFDSSSACAH